MPMLQPPFENNYSFLRDETSPLIKSVRLDYEPRRDIVAATISNGRLCVPIADQRVQIRL